MDALENCEARTQSSSSPTLNPQSDSHSLERPSGTRDPILAEMEGDGEDHWMTGSLE